MKTYTVLEKMPNTLWSLRIIWALESDIIDSDIVPFLLIAVKCVISFGGFNFGYLINPMSTKIPCDNTQDDN